MECASDVEDTCFDLPVAVIRHVFALLGDGVSVARCSVLGRTWRAAAQDEALWRSLFHTRWTDGLLPTEDAAATSYAKRHRLGEYVNVLHETVKQARNGVDDDPIISTQKVAFYRAREELTSLAQDHSPEWLLHELHQHARGDSSCPWLVCVIQDCACRLLARVVNAPADGVSTPLVLVDASCAITLLVDPLADTHALKTALASVGAAARTAVDAANLDPDDALGRAKVVIRFLTGPIPTDAPTSTAADNHHLARFDTARLDGLMSELVREAHELAPCAAETGSGLGFGNNGLPYEHPLNSSLAYCLGCRRGLPITLAVVAVAVAWHAGIEILPVNAPGHFLTRVPPPQNVFFDVHGGGEQLNVVTIGEPAWLQTPPSPATVARRMLMNVYNHTGRSSSSGISQAMELLNMR